MIKTEGKHSIHSVRSIQAVLLCGWAANQNQLLQACPIEESVLCGKGQLPLRQTASQLQLPSGKPHHSQTVSDPDLYGHSSPPDCRIPPVPIHTCLSLQGNGKLTELHFHTKWFS